jgi:hypothetical protein
MYSTLIRAPEHAVVDISELLAAHGHQFATVQATQQQNPATKRGDSLVFNIDEGLHLNRLARPQFQWWSDIQFQDFDGNGRARRYELCSRFDIHIADAPP